MPPYKEMYFHLFNAITDALEATAKDEYQMARNILVAAQQWGEEQYMESGENSDS